MAQATTGYAWTSGEVVTPAKLNQMVNSATVSLTSSDAITSTGSTTPRTLANRFADTVNVKDFGAVGDGVADDTAAIQAALNSTATSVYFPTGSYRIANDGVTSNAAITSSVANRRIFGDGIITATSQVKRALGITGNNTTVTLHFDGNLNIGTAIYVAADNPVITGCRISNLDGKTTWQGVGVHLAFDGRDTSALVSNNVIKNLQGAGDGVGGNGVGMQRAVTVETDQNCSKQILITGNVIDAVEGEEGDSIVVAAGTSASPLDLPVTISNNSINFWTRRAIKIQARKVSVINNTFQNNRNSDIGTLQRVIDVTSGSDIVIQGNTFQNCKYQAQVAAFLNSPQVGNNFVVSGNSVYGLGAETTSDIFVFRTYGSNVSITGNTIVCPNYASTAAIDVLETSQVVIAGNLVVMSSSGGIWYSFTNVTNTRIFGNVSTTNDSYQSYIDYNNSGEHVVDLSSGGSRTLALTNRDTVLSDGELIAALGCRQNDVAFPNGLHGSVKFMAEGTSGNTALTLNSGSGTTPNVERLRVKANGRVGIGVDPSSALHVDGDVTVSNATTATTATAGARTLPANPVDYLVVSINGTSRKIPYYAT
jgi:hypothetical protein